MVLGYYGLTGGAGRRVRLPCPRNITSNHRRDAWASIRGYYYQVQVTALRWLALSPNQELFCERGEDIEVISEALAAGDAPEQILEQIKVRDALSLRSSEVVSALMRFHETRQLGATPTLFRFVTTAAASTEQNPPFPRGLPGLVAWNLARTRGLAANEVKQFADDTRLVLLNANKPRGIPDKLAASFRARLSQLDTAGFVAEFVDVVEWALGSDDLPSLQQELRLQLRQTGRATSDDDARRQASLLIVHILNLISQPGQKKLASGDVDAVLARHVPSGADARILALLESFSNRTAAQLDLIEGQNSKILSTLTSPTSGPLQAILGQLERLATQQVVAATAVVDEQPFLHPWVLQRHASVAAITTALTSDRVVILLGATGMGKTTLGAQTFTAWTIQPRHWISFRGRVRGGARTHLIQQLLLRTGRAAGDAPIEFSRLSATYVGALRKGLLVLDDLPDLSADSSLADHIASLAAQIVDGGGHILCTAHRLPDDFVHLFPKPVRSLVVAGLALEEIEAVLRLSGIDNPPLDPSMVELILLHTSGHPALVVATARHIRTSASFDRRSLTALLSSDVTKGVRVETRRRLRTLLSERARELGDRLSIIGPKFDRSMAFAVGSVPPPLPQCGELLDELEGICVHAAGMNYEFSPLLRDVGVEMLDPVRLRRVHAAIARELLKSGTVTPLQVIDVIVHLISAQKWDDLKGFAIQIARKIKTKEHAETLALLTSFNRPTFPPESPMPVDARMALRTLQIQVATMADRSTTWLLADLRQMTGQVTPTAGANAAFLAWVLVGPLSSSAPAALRIEGSLRAMQLAGLQPRQISEGLQGTIELLIWTAIPSLRAPADTDAFIDALLGMSDREFQRAFSAAEVSKGIELIVLKSIEGEMALPSIERNWSRPLGRLERLAEKGRTANVGVVVDAAEREMVTIWSDHLQRSDDAMRLMLAGINEKSGTEQMRRHHLLGGLLLHQGRLSEALDHFDLALEGPRAEDNLTFGDAARSAAEVAAKQSDWPRAIAYAIRAIRPLRASRLPYEALDMTTELAWLHWQAGDKRRAVAALNRVVRWLRRNEDVAAPRHRESFRKAGMLLGWLGTLEPGGQDFWTEAGNALPFPGWASRRRSQLADLQNPMSWPLTLYLLGRVADNAGQRRIALARLQEARLLAHSEGASEIERMIAIGQAQLLASEGQPENAIAAAMYGVKMYSIDKRHPAPAWFSTIDIDATWDTLSIERQAQIQRRAFWEAIGPCFAGAVGRGATNDQFAALLKQTRSAMAAAQPAEQTYWERILSLAEAVFVAAPNAYNIQLLIRQHGNDEADALTILYLALMRTTDVSLAHACGAQVLCLTTFPRYGLWSNTVLRDLARYVVAFWREVAGSRAFALSSPALLRRAVGEVSTDGIAAAARLLLTARIVTNVNLSKELVQSLESLEKSS